MTNREKQINPEESEEQEITKVKAEKKPEKPHAIEISYVGTPGQEKLVAYTINGDQVEITRFEGRSVFKIKEAAIKQSEEDAISKIHEEGIMGSVAEEANKTSKLEAEDISKLVRLLEGIEDKILFVDVKTIENPSVPKEGLHVLIPKGTAEETKPHLDNFGYSIREIEGVGFVAEKGNSKLVFLYASERADKIAA